MIFFNFLLRPLPRGSRPGMTLCSAPTWRIGGVHQTAWFFFVLVISFTLYLENFLGSLEMLAEIDGIREALGSRVEPLDGEFFLTLLL